MSTDYPWDNKAFDELMKTINGKIKPERHYYRLGGFPIAMQVWFYECCSKFDSKIAVRNSDHIPKILNWTIKRDFPRRAYFIKGMFREGNKQISFRNITPTPMELQIILLPLEYIESDTTPLPSPSVNIEAHDDIQTHNSDDDFQDPPKSNKSKGKEKGVSDSGCSPMKKKLRQSSSVTSKKTPPKVVAKRVMKRPTVNTRQATYKEMC